MTYPEAKDSNQPASAKGSSPVSRKAKLHTAASTADVIQKNNVQNKPIQASKAQTASISPASAQKLSSKDEPKETAFRLDAPSAREVLLAADFTDWEKAPIKMIKGGGGVWHVKTSLAPGRHLYRFLVDGEWRNDPNHGEQVPNPFGTTNSVIEVS